MSDINVVMIQGRIPNRPPSITSGATKAGETWHCGRFSIASNYSKKVGGEWVNQANWIPCVTWSDHSIKELSKPENFGSMVMVQGRLEVRDDVRDPEKKRKWIEVVCDRVQILMKSSRRAPVPSDVGYAVDEGRTEEAPRTSTVDDDDVPF